jgi:hypothetical protein
LRPDEPVYTLDEEPLYSCPQALVDDEAIEALEMWAWMERGFLPRPGGIDDQLERDLELITAVAAQARKKKNNF